MEGGVIPFEVRSETTINCSRSCYKVSWIGQVIIDHDLSKGPLTSLFRKSKLFRRSKKLFSHKNNWPTALKRNLCIHKAQMHLIAKKMLKKLFLKLFFWWICPFDCEKIKRNQHWALLTRRSSIYRPFWQGDVTWNFYVAGEKIRDRPFWWALLTT